MKRWVLVSQTPKGGGGGSTPLYNPYRFVPLQRVGFLGFGLESGVGFEVTTGVYERFIVLIPDE